MVRSFIPSHTQLTTRTTGPHDFGLSRDDQSPVAERPAFFLWEESKGQLPNFVGANVERNSFPSDFYYYFTCSRMWVNERLLTLKEMAAILVSHRGFSTGQPTKIKGLDTRRSSHVWGIFHFVLDMLAKHRSGI